MSRIAPLAFVAAAAFAATGCQKDVCADIGGACVALHVKSQSPSLTDVDQLAIDGSGFVQVDPLRTPTAPKKMSLPLDVAIGFHQQASGSETIHVLAFLAGNAVGDGSTAVNVTAGKHVDADILLATSFDAPDLSMGGDDLGGDVDLANADLTGVIPKHKGDACTPSDVCDTGHCVDGVCCDSACNGACTACTVTGLVGTCSAIPPGGSPVHGMCATQAPSTCGLNGTCDGAGACAKYPQGTLCGTSACDSGTNKFTPAPKCDGAGVCQMLAQQDCAPYRCKDATQCYGPPCSGTGECSGTNTCVNGSCGLLSDGRPCTANGQCVNGNCVDGVCCNVACAGQCQACDIPDSMSNLGVCQTVMSGAPHGTRTPCTGTGTTCGGSCMGTPTACTYTPTTTRCNSSCKSSSTETDFYCSGTGTCSMTGTDLACTGGFICSGTSCLTSCGSSTMCQSPYVCMAPSCTLCGNGVKDGGETDVDCGGTSCGKKCAVNKMCSAGTDCVTGSCIGGLCTLATNTPKWLTLAPMPDSRTEPAVAWATTSSLYVMGGSVVSGTKLVTTSDIDIYNTQTNTWTIDSNGVGITGGTGTGLGGGFAWLIGGYDTDMFFDTNQIWQFLGATSKTSMPTSRAYSAAAWSITDAHHYVVGGAPYTTGTACLTKSEGYSTATNTWLTGTAMAHGRCGLAAAADRASGRIYAYGGEGHLGMHDIQGTIESWKPGDASWTQFTATMPHPRSYVAGAMGSDGRLYAIGGEDATFSAAGYVDAFNPVTGRWDSVALLNSPRTRAGAAIGPDNRIYVIGGQDAPGGPGPPPPLNVIEAYGPVGTLSPTHAKAGVTVNVTGSNFAANATVTIGFGFNPPGQTVQTSPTNASGVMTATSFTVPAGSSAGGYVVQLMDDKSQYPIILGFAVDP